MRYLGIDFGEKRVGIALSEEAGKIAFPHSVLINDGDLIKNIREICSKNLITTVVLGESRNFQGEANEIMHQVENFRKKLEDSGLNIVYEPEFLTSVQASQITGENKMIDASAAALILQSFLNKMENKIQDNSLVSKAQEKGETEKNNSSKITYDDFKKVEIKMGKILSAEKVDKSEKLLRLMVDFKEDSGPRQIVSGIAKYFPSVDVLLNKKCAFVTNLEPRSLMGLESNGMLFAVSTDDGHFSLFETDDEALVGIRAK